MSHLKFYILFISIANAVMRSYKSAMALENFNLFVTSKVTDYLCGAKRSARSGLRSLVKNFLPFCANRIFVSVGTTESQLPNQSSPLPQSYFLKIISITSSHHRLCHPSHLLSSALKTNPPPLSSRI